MVVVLLVLAHALVADHRLAGLHALHEPQPLELVEDPVDARAAHPAPLSRAVAPFAQRVLDLDRRQGALLASSSSTTARRAPPRLCPAAASVASARSIHVPAAPVVSA